MYDSRQHDRHSTANQMLFTCRLRSVARIRRSDRRLPRWFLCRNLYGGPSVYFGGGFGIGFFGGFGWGWHHWDYDWTCAAIYNHNTYISHSARSSIATTSITTAAILTMATRSTAADLGRKSRIPWAPPSHSQPGTRSGAFSGFDQAEMSEAFLPRAV